ncbi:MAG TPA: 8-amino-7-oxononanoate synthase [Porphyromonadaceae bacterium]|jgi:8-amino-7-oxononanoate synthase|uniref:serine palmitoyltransferase n=1 Tax=Limibacterium fermenti TaxID=3229863 RepID=UPI000E97F813|nr:8-amino-7-oxononanoate synthase [Porphyromonadaceae bacterium]HBK30055.1 8-amino-7-oxononanoate synthase [Porphyromonadaceae bacterium]HBL34362.1 8-amino-7-oxononanoate synthase [Porphyromonadaceae bacterium]HBX18857.1 8-amino-7-oxononanoate synthase [Porphyromonadaceae bacterium]HBX46067.1 8-amino-7-oxononanoate synthase [Porphyromonadaceae bacterium]
MDLLREKTMRYDAPQRAKAAGIYPYFRAIESDQDTEVIINGKKVLMFGSNAYLGLTNHPKVIEASIAATKKYGTGMAGSRFLNGTLDIHLELERKLANFMDKEEAIVFPTGFMVNEGVLGCLTGRDDYILWDERDHASIIEGLRTSFSTKYKFRHNDMASLEKQLQRCNSHKVKLIVVDGVFSMEGDLANLPEIMKLAKKYNANIMVDEAHSLGVLGRKYNGKGVCDHFGLLNDVDLVMGTFSKSLASIGGFVAGDYPVINYLRHNARTNIFSASITPGATAAASAALDILKAEPERVKHLWELTHYTIKRFKDLGFELGPTETPIMPLYVRDNDKTFYITKLIFEEGIFVNPVVSPGVAPEDTLIRFALMATHSIEQVDYAIERIYKIFKKVGIL